MTSSSEIQNVQSWLQFIILLISIITIGIKVGQFTGKQDQINLNQNEKNKQFENADIKTANDVKILDDKVNNIERNLGDKIDKVGKDVEYIKGKMES